jgi:hypothetical protein
VRDLWGTTIRLNRFGGPSPLAVGPDVRKADGMKQGPLPFLELVKTRGSGHTTVYALADVTVQFAAGASKLVST